MSETCWEDGWFLLSVKYAQASGGMVTKEEVIKSGDYINHAIFMESEIEHAVSVLSEMGLLYLKNGNFTLGPSFDEFWANSGAEKHRAVSKQLEAIVSELQNT